MLKLSRPNMDAAVSHPAVLPSKTIFRQMELRNNDDDFVPKCDCESTLARPGSVEKIEVMIARLEAGQPIFHVADEWMHCTYEQELEREAWMKANSKSWEKEQMRGTVSLTELSKITSIRQGDLKKVVDTLLVPYKKFCLSKWRYDAKAIMEDIASGDLAIPQTPSKHRPKKIARKGERIC